MYLEPCSVVPLPLSAPTLQCGGASQRRSQENVGGGKGKVPVLTATLMASICGFLGKSTSESFNSNYCQHFAAALT